MFERFAQSARTAVDDAKYEAARRGDRRIDTEHLLIALLHDERLAHVVGVDAATLHEAADELDRYALAAVGVELGDYRPAGRAALGKPVPLTSGAKEVIRQSLVYAGAEKARTITQRHIMLAILDRPKPDPAVTLLDALGADVRSVRDRLAADSSDFPDSGTAA